MVAGSWAESRHVIASPAGTKQSPLGNRGDRIAFASNRGSTWLQRLFGDWNYDIWVMNADGTGMMQLTMDSRYEGHPCWGSGEDIYFHTYGGWWMIRNWDVWGMTLAR